MCDNNSVHYNVHLCGDQRNLERTLTLTVHTGQRLIITRAVIVQSISQLPAVRHQSRISSWIERTVIVEFSDSLISLDLFRRCVEIESASE